MEDFLALAFLNLISILCRRDALLKDINGRNCFNQIITRQSNLTAMVYFKREQEIDG